MPTTTPLFLCIDQGGHASRALIIDARGVVCARAERPVTTRQPKPDWVEHDAEELVDSVRAAMEETLRALGPNADRIVAAGLATQRSSIVCWDRAGGAALSPVISWQDRRAHAWLKQFTPHQRDVHARTGLMLSAHYGASKLRWCLDHFPAVQRAAAAGTLACGPLASFLLFRLLDARPLLVDPSNAGRTLVWNLAARDWDEHLLALFGIERALLPACVPTRHAYGTLRPGSRDVPVTIMNGDQSAALFAAGAPDSKTAYINIGTGAFVLHAASQRPTSDRLLSSIAYSDDRGATYLLEGTVNGAGSALVWIGETLDIENVERKLDEWMKQESAPPLFLNGISGLGAPFWMADFASRFEGQGTAEQQVVAVAESIVFLLQANLDEFARSGVTFSRIVASGGLAQSSALCQRLADLNGLPLSRSAEPEATGMGLAFLLAGRPRDWPRPPVTDFRPLPNTPLHERYARWRALMDAAVSSTA